MQICQWIYHLFSFLKYAFYSTPSIPTRTELRVLMSNLILYVVLYGNIIGVLETTTIWFNIRQIDYIRASRAARLMTIQFWSNCTTTCISQRLDLLAQYIKSYMMDLVTTRWIYKWAKALASQRLAQLYKLAVEQSWRRLSLFLKSDFLALVLNDYIVFITHTTFDSLGAFVWRSCESCPYLPWE